MCTGSSAGIHTILIDFRTSDVQLFASNTSSAMTPLTDGSSLASSPKPVPLKDMTSPVILVTPTKIASFNSFLDLFFWKSLLADSFTTLKQWSGLTPISQGNEVLNIILVSNSFACSVWNDSMNFEQYFLSWPLLQIWRFQNFKQTKSCRKLISFQIVIAYSYNVVGQSWENW